ncbi:DNA replication licensing factor MCM4 [Aphelenchoides besseyi]|nr:DNA replication licensing factor MCM4 [Aphelenchoides besseyi]
MATSVSRWEPSPLVMSEGRAASPTPSSVSDGSTLRYGSDFGGSIVSGLSQRSGATTQSHLATKKGHSRADTGTRIGHHRFMSINSESDPLSMDVTEAEDNERPAKKLYIWGTRITVDMVQQTFREFILNFRPEIVDEDETTVVTEDGQRVELNLNEPYYVQRLQEINRSEIPILNLNLKHIREFKETLYKLIVAYPADTIPYLDMTVNDIFKEICKRTLTPPIECRPFNAEQTKNMRDLDPDDVEQLITVNGMVTRNSPIIPQMRTGYFECQICKFSVEVEVDRGLIEEPVNCTNCNNTYCFQLIHNRSIFVDKQVIKLQEIPGSEHVSQTQHSITLVVHGSLVESVYPGDRIFVTGIYRANFTRQNPARTTLNAVLQTTIDVLHFRKMNQNRLHDTNDGSYLSEERIAEIRKLAEDPNIIKRLCSALAPQIYGHEDIKQGLLCQVFGGTTKPTIENRNRIRDEINILLCGDPGTAKSQLLQYIYRLIPRSQYTSGKGSSAVGLSASVARDPDSKGVVLQPGALVMADNGVCCIDEFDKMSDATRTILHEVMEQQTLSIAKAGIVCQLNARTSVLAAANPIGSKWDNKKNIVENLNLEHTLLSRFDLIFLVIDPRTDEYDRDLARHLINFYIKGKDDDGPKEDVLDMSILRDYIAYAKANIHPKLTPEAEKAFLEYYLDMRSSGQQKGQIGAYPRQLQSIIRLSEATAKMRLKQKVDKEDVDEALNLFTTALRQAAVDPSTGLIDVGILGGVNREDPKKLDKLPEENPEDFDD